MIGREQSISTWACRKNKNLYVAQSYYTFHPPTTSPLTFTYRTFDDSKYNYTHFLLPLTDVHSISLFHLSLSVMIQYHHYYYRHQLFLYIYNSVKERRRKKNIDYCCWDKLRREISWKNDFIIDWDEFK